ncbi:DNA polymerase III subunit alpha [Prevotella copri]|jgi:DNA polymerase-3 subunit alpha|uniref:DNA-directed DNA polymerase n=1 Tax=Segatella copri TaxID=165179 RepID=A0AAW5IAF1_9BACT|nr:DNA polymerase III subunit alpha [Segatella copri]MCP9549470.1 DNA polymerase III subunit alpha [Segatella copri]MCP9554827.1 DNA polymerase III subunit alpha [Segatella copri]MCP9569851.1 DNA polymerase III subunit alpha [Segatella copri]
MKILSIKHHTSTEAVQAIDCFVDNGYLQGPGGSLPDVDVDFQSDRRQEVKEYIERRYNHDGKQRVFSAGTLTTLKLKAVLKDVARVHRVPVNIVNYITAIFEDDNMSWTDLFVLAATNKRVKSFIQEYPQVIEDIRTLMGQPRSSSIHASALLVTPDDKDGKDMECFDFTPIKKVDDMLISEFDGYVLDEQGLLKNDCLGIKELSKLQAVIKTCNSEYGTNLTFQGIVQGGLDDQKVYSLLQQGYTQNVFQFSSKGMTKFLVSMKPSKIDDLIAANALFRPATLDSGSTDIYVDCKLGDSQPKYLWGTYNAMKDTYGVLCYQEQLAQIAREVGGLSLGEGVKLVKFISKKKQEKIDAYKGKFMEGANKNGCPKEQATEIWHMFEVAGGYLFNKSHATAYAVTAYAGAYLKANYPTAFYTVALQWAKDDQIPTLMSEMELCSNAKIVAPDINVSGDTFFTNYETNEIFWSLTRIKNLGAKATEWIVNERKTRGDFTSIDNFIDRVFRYKLKKYQYWDDPDNPDEATKCPVNARHIRHLILAGCFDKVEHAQSVVERFAILQKAAEHLGFEIQEKDIPTDLRGKHYFWSQQQIAISGIGAIDYKRIYDNSEAKPKIKGRAAWAMLKNVKEDDYDGKRVAICASIVEIEEKKFLDKKTGANKTFCKVLLQQNNDLVEMVIWNDEWANLRSKFCNGGSPSSAKNKMIICSAQVKYSDFAGGNNLQIYKSSVVEIM